jgi:hypothetical protein
VTFTGAGTCLVDFNDVGTGAFAAAVQVRQTVKVYEANTVYPSEAPAAGTINGAYTTSATATSGDTVVVTLASGSTGCTLVKQVVTFSANGVCEIDFNDAGNGAFAASTQVRQTITVGTGNPLAQAPITLTSRRATRAHLLTLTSSGGSGAGTVTYSVKVVGTAGCSIRGDILRTKHAGTCSVTVTKSADATYGTAKSPATSVTVAATPPRATRMGSAVWTGRTITTSIIGSGFFAKPRIISNVGGTKVTVLHDNGHQLTIRVQVARSTPRGEHRFTLIFSGAQRTSVRYRQR